MLLIDAVYLNKLAQRPGGELRGIKAAVSLAPLRSPAAGARIGLHRALRRR